jgi:RNA-binding protein YhbY
MTPEERAEIRARAEGATYHGGLTQEVADDVLALLDEVERLRVRLAEAKAEHHRSAAAGWEEQVRAERAEAQRNQLRAFRDAVLALTEPPNFDPEFNVDPDDIRALAAEHRGKP